MIASSSPPPPPVSLESSPGTEEKPKKKKKKKKESYKDMIAAMTVRWPKAPSDNSIGIFTVLLRTVFAEFEEDGCRGEGRPSEDAIEGDHR